MENDNKDMSINNIPWHLYDNDTINYYKKKYNYLKSVGWFNQKEPVSFNTVHITPDTVKKLVENLNQIVFEVTDNCNLQCKYCAYGDLYYDYDKRTGKNMDFNSVKNVLDFVFSNIPNSKDILYVSFYGGEPLLNMDVIKSTINYIQSKKLSRKIIYTMTTNGILLTKHIDFLQKMDFRVLVSLDGDRTNNSYRIFPSGKESFEIVYRNLKQAQRQYPSFFKNNININSVLHNRNSDLSVHRFVFKEFAKAPQLSPLDDAGVKKEKMSEFIMMQSSNLHVDDVEDKKKLFQEQGCKNPIINKITNFFHNTLKQTCFTYYEELLQNNSFSIRTPSGTCFPFQKKLFVTVNGKILPCERIDQRHVLGYATANRIDLDYKKIADKYNHIFNNVVNSCKKCYQNKTCTQCLFQIEDIEKQTSCPHLFNYESIVKYYSDIISNIVETPEVVDEIIDKILII